MKAKPKTSKDAWVILEKIFTDNKRSKIELVGEVHGLDIGDLTVDAYFHKIDAIASRLNNLGSNVTNGDLFTFAINGFNEKYDQVAQIMLTGDPFSDLENVRSMVTTGENLCVWNFARGICMYADRWGLGQGQLFNAYTQLLQAHQALLGQAQRGHYDQDFGNEGWNMDTDATLHLNSNANNLSSILNKRMIIRLARCFSDAIVSKISTPSQNPPPIPKLSSRVNIRGTND
ncbi:hypothetical protein Tco_1033904 [Tanacetum coccineum]